MNFEHCIRCTICVENCPVLRVNPDFPGPKQAGPDAQRFRSDTEKSFDEWVLLCSQCKRCVMSCPCDVEPAEIILKAQQIYGQGHPQTAAHLLFANNYYLSALGSFLAPVANRFTASESGKKILRSLGIATYIPFPKFRFRTLRLDKKSRIRGMKKVALFYGCYTNFYRPDIGHETIRLLSFFNIDVVLPRQWCCGLPALGNGNLTLARFFAQKNAASLSNYIDAGYDIVYNCTSCGQAILHDYANILKIAQAKKIAENTYNVHEYIVKLMDEGYIKPQFQEVHRKLAYHIPCHLRALGIGYPAAKLMSLIPGLTFEILDDACCGLSGSYGLKKSNGDTSMQIGKRAVVHIKNTGAAAIVADCGSCRMQLGGLSGLTTLDPVEVLSEALRITEIRARK